MTFSEFDLEFGNSKELNDSGYLFRPPSFKGLTSKVWSKVRFWEFGNQKTRNDLLSFLDCHVLDAWLILGSRRNFEGLL
ncbi:unnamed protein product [Rhizophagus irregularis]|nr:unnamed protein product [Rhizophagus irregularis]